VGKGRWKSRLSLCSSRYWAAKAPPFKVNLRLNPSQSKAATDAGSSRNTTTPFGEVVQFQRNHVSRKKMQRPIYSQNPWQNIPSFVAVLGHQGPTIQSQSNTHPSQSTAATIAAISRTTTTTVCEVAKFRRNYVLTKKVLQSICRRKPLQNVHRCRSNPRI
jgi:hypothetical protein